MADNDLSASTEGVTVLDGTIQRAALITWFFAQGAHMTSDNVAEVCDFSVQSARALLRQLAEILPIERGRGGVWSVVEPEPEEGGEEQTGET